MSTPAQQVRPKAAPAPALRRRGAEPVHTQQGRAGPVRAASAGGPRYLRASLRVGGLNDPEEREAEHAASVVAFGGSYQVRDPGGVAHLRAADAPAQPGAPGPVRSAVAPAVADPGAEGRVRRSVPAEPVVDPAAAGRLRRMVAPAATDPGGFGHLRAMHGGPAAETIHRVPAAPTADVVQRAEAEPMAGVVHRAPAGPAADVVHRAPGAAPPASDAEAANRIEAARSAVARPLPAPVKARLEHGFGQRLDAVRVHTGPSARVAAAAIGARAYTEGNRITLGHGESEHDLHLMAHEATHVVQNRAAVQPPASRRSAAASGEIHRSAAEPAAASATIQRTAAAPVAAGETIQRTAAAPVAAGETIHRSAAEPVAASGTIHRTATESAVASGTIHRTAAEPAAASGTIHRTAAEPAPASGPIRRFGIDTVLDFLADKANLIPGFRMFTIILGVNPVNMSSVDRSAANILRAVVELMPGGGLIVQALDKYGVFEKAGGWVSQQIDSLGITGAAIGHAVSEFIDSLHWRDALHPGDVWDRAKRIFTEPIDRIISFIHSLVDGVIQFVKDAVLRPLAELASKTRAWDLLIALLGKNPITGEAVPQTAETLIGGFMKLIGQEEVWQNLQKSHAVARAFAWFKGAMATLLAFAMQIPGLFLAALKSFAISDLLDLPGAIGRVLGMFGNFAGRFFAWAANAVWNLLEIIFDVVSPGAWGYIKKTGAALKSILKNPLPFVHNLVQAAKLGLGNFAEHFGTHLKAGLIDWLTGSLPGVYIPKAFSLAEVGKFALSVLGITWAQIRGKIVKALGPTGEKIMAALETTFDVVVALVKGGPAAAWELIKDKLTNLKDMVIEGITSFVIETIVKQAIPKLVAMFIPGAGFISAILSIYDTVMVFVQKLAKIAAAVMAFIDSIVAIAAGQIAGAAHKVESALAGLLSLAISFLAGFLGLGNIASKVMGVVGKVRAFVDKALDTAIGWIVGKAKALFAKLFGGGKDKQDDRTDAQKLSDLQSAVTSAENLLSAKDTDIESVRKQLPQLKSKYRLTTLDLVIDADDPDDVTAHVHGEINPKTDGPKKRKAKGVVGPLKITRKSLSFTSATKDALIGKFKALFPKGQLGQFKDANLDIRHKVSISDTIKHTDAALSPLTVEQAAAKLAEQGYSPTGKGRPGIIGAARELLQAANNDLNNLFVGASGKNRRKGKRYDVGDAAGESAPSKKYDPQKAGFIGEYGFAGTDFDVTIDITEDGVHVETWKITA